MHCLLIQPIHRVGVERLQQAGIEVSVATSTDMAVVAGEIGAADAVITRNAGLSGEAMAAAAALKVLGVHGTGYDAVDVPTASRLGIPIVYTPFANVQSVAEHAISQMLAIAKRTREGDKAVREGRFEYRYQNDFHELAGRTLAVIGFGKIGRRTAEIARLAFQMRVVVYSPNAPADEIIAAGMEPVTDLDEALRIADVVSLHQRLTPQNRGLFNAERLATMKPGAMLVNTARGGLIDAEALIASVESGHLLGAALDVFEQEPLPLTHPYTACDRIVLSPHLGGATGEAMQRTALEVAQQVVDVLTGNDAKWLVNADIWARRRR